jgi:hypothetical protein
MFFSLEHGLHQNLPEGTNPDKVPSKYKYLFNKHRDMPSHWFARSITKALREFIAPCLQLFTTSRSLRKAASILLSLHPQVSHGAKLARCGWSANDTSDSYTVDTVAASFPGMKVLSGWEDANVHVHAPTLNSLVEVCSMSKLQEFIECLYVVSLGEFKKGGRLRIVLETCTAAVVMYFNELMLESGKGKAMYLKLVEASRECGLASSTSGAVQLLWAWSERIRADRR